MNLLREKNIQMEQSGFIPNWNISILKKKLLNIIQINKSLLAICSLDIFKVFDSLKLPFLKEILSTFKFEAGFDWILLIIQPSW